MWFSFANTYVGLISETRNRSHEEMKRRKSEPPIYYPILLNLQGKKCVVVGGGHVALRKVKMLLDCGADITVISPKPHLSMAKLFEKKTIRLIHRDYKVGDLAEATLAVASTDVREINRTVAHEAERLGILVNVVDDPRLSSFILPSFFRRGNLTIAVSSAGASPALARKIRSTLEKSIGKEYAILLSLISEVRASLKKSGCVMDGEAWQEVLDLKSLIRLIQKGQRKKAKILLLNKLKAHRGDHWIKKRLLPCVPFHQ
jgi:siroheme synthase-like protein